MRTKQCVNCPGAVDHTTAECPIAPERAAPPLPAAGSAVEEVVPQYQRGALLIDSDTMSRFTRIAREAAISGVHRYSYMPTTPEEAKNWHPHSWVIDAMHLVQRDALSALSAPPEFCCELSYKAAKQKAWNARRIDRCKCDHNEYCDHCWPADFRPGGKWHGKFVAQQSTHVSVPRELVARLQRFCQRPHSSRDEADELDMELRGLLNGGEA